MLSASFKQALAGSPAIEDFQRALKNLAQAAANSSWDPGTVTGTVTDQTIGATARVITHLISAAPALRQMTGVLVSALHTAVKNSSARPLATDLLGRYAQQLTMAARVLAYRYMAGGYPQPQPPDVAFSGPMDLVSTSRTYTNTQKAASAPGVKKYPVGSIKTDGGAVWRVAIPKAAAQAALGGADFGGGDLVETEPVPKGTTLVDALDALLTEVTGVDFKKETTPWYKKWQTYAIAGGAVVVIGGAVILLR